MAKKKVKLWFGFLEAGERSSLVVRDPSIDTGQASTIYLYNAVKGRILEYRREIVEPKLRELGESETGLVVDLREAYESARAGFTPRGASLPKPRPIRRPKPVEPDPPDLDDGDWPWPLLEDEPPDPLSAGMAD